MAHAGSLAGRGASAGIFGRGKLGNDSQSVSFAGHTATHSRQPVHSADLIVTSLSTGSAEGHALKHFAQSMQVSGFRRIRAGLKNDAISLSVDAPLPQGCDLCHAHFYFLPTCLPIGNTAKTNRLTFVMCPPATA